MKQAPRKLTILVDADMHRALLTQVGRGNIGTFLANAAKPILAARTSLPGAYAEMAADEKREKEANEWGEGLISDAYGV